MDTEQTASAVNNEVQMVEKDESKRKTAAKAQIQNYFLMLTEGCGDPACGNSEHCSTAAPDMKLNPNEAAIRAVSLLKSKAPLCQKYRAKQGAGKRRAPAKKNRTNNRRQESPMEVDATPTNSNPPNNVLSDSYSSRAQASDGAARPTRHVGRWEAVDRREGEEGALDSEDADPYAGAEDPLPLDFLMPPHALGQHSDSDRESEGAPTGSSGEGSSVDLGAAEAMIRNLISGFRMERGLGAEAPAKQKRPKKTKYKEYKLASLHEISQFPYLDEEKVTHLLSTPTTPSNSDTEQSASSADVNKVLSSVFSNPYALSKSFLKRLPMSSSQTQDPPLSSPPDNTSSSSKQKILPAIGVDVDSVDRAFSLICSLEDDRLEESLSKSLHKLGKELYRINVELIRSSRSSMTQPFHLLNVYALLTQCPLLATPRFLRHGLPHLAQAMASLGPHDQEELVIWYAGYSDENLLNIVQTFQQLITYRILDRTQEGEPYEIHTDEVVEAGVKSLRIFYLASLLSAKNKGFTRPYQVSKDDQENRLTPMSVDPIIEKFGIYPNSITRPTIPFEDFYNESLNGVIDAHDIERALVNLSSSRKFSFLRYSFVLSAATKVLKLFCDNKFEMIEERRRTIFNIIFTDERDNPFLNLQVNRNSLLLDTLGNIEAVADMNPNMFKKQLRVKFEGEDGLDEGGPQKEFFQLLIEELFNPDIGMFYILDGGRDYWFNMFSFENEANFRLIGILFGLAIYNSIILDVHFPMTVYRKLLNCTPIYDDLHASHPLMARGFEDLLSYEGEDVEEAFMLTFNIAYTGQFGETVTYDLVDNGEDIPVTKQNRKSYVELYSDWLLNKSIETQFTAFKSGFDLVVRSNPLDDMFIAEEVELLICGSQNFDFKELEKTASYEGFTQTQSIMVDFWDVVHGFPEERKRQLLQFITGTDRVPVGGLSQIRLIIVRNGPDSDRLPSAHTCFNALLLPNYSSKDKLTERLLKALKFGKGFGMI